MLSRAFLKRAQGDAGVDRAAVVELRVGFEVLAVYVEKVLAAECLRCGGDRGVELAMQVFERVAAQAWRT